MVTVYLGGKLGNEFGKKFTLSLAKPKDVIFALDANCPGFYKRLLDLAKDGGHYSLVVDGKSIQSPGEAAANKKFKEIHIIPMIIGAAGVAVAVGAILYAATIIAPTALGPSLVALFTIVGGALISYGISNLLQKNSTIDSAGSGSAQANALNKSFLFSNGDNVTEQGIPVALGYGRLRVGSAVIQSTIKSFTSKSTTFNEFTGLAVKKGESFMAMVDSQRQLQILPTEEA